MYLTSIFIFLILIFGIFPIYLSIRFNFKVLLSFVITTILVLLIYNFPGYEEVCNIVGNNIYNNNLNVFMERFSTLEDALLWFKINILFLLYLFIFIASFILLKLFIRNKSNFRTFENPIVRKIIKVILVFFNILFFSVIMLILLVNLNSYLLLEEGFLTRLFYVIKRIIYGL